MDFELCENIKNIFDEALRNQEELKKNVKVLKEEMQNVECLKTRNSDHQLIFQNQLVELECKINQAMELYKIEMNRVEIIEKNTDKLEAVHQQVKNVLQDKMVIANERVSQISMLRGPSLHSDFEHLQKLFGVHQKDKIKVPDWCKEDVDGIKVNPDESYINQDCNQMNNQRSPGFFLKLTSEDFTVDKLLAVPPLRRSPMVTSSGTGNKLVVPKAEFVSPRVQSGVSPSTFSDQRLTKKLFGNRLELKENISPKTPIRSPVTSLAHKWKKKDFMVGQSCLVCTDLIIYPSKLVQCTKCKKTSHAICKELAASCLQDREKTKSAKKPRTPKSASKSYCIGKLKDLVSQTSPKVPALITKIVSEIETRGINEINLYKEHVPEKEVVSLLKGKLKVKGQINLFDVSVHVLCGCLKEFFRRLDEPLVPRNKLKELSEIINNDEISIKNYKLLKLIQGLEPANKDTLVFMILHLQRIGSKTKNNISDISKLLGPYILGCLRDDTENIPVETTSINKIMAELLLVPPVSLVQVLPSLDKTNKPDVSSPKPTFRFFNTSL